MPFVDELLEDGVWAVDEAEGGGGVELGLKGIEDGGANRPDVVHVGQASPV